MGYGVRRYGPSGGAGGGRRRLVVLCSRRAIVGHTFSAGLRFVREAINSLVPFVGVGGDIIGARLLAQFGIATNVAIASVLIDIFIQVVCLLVFVAAGIGIVLDLAGTHRLTAADLRHGGSRVARSGRILSRLEFRRVRTVRALACRIRRKAHDWAAFNHVADLGGRLQQIWQNHRGLSASFLVHLAAVFFGASEVWIALSFMGHPVSVAEAVAIESLGQGSRSAAFVLPGGLGVQDGALIAASAIFGIPADIALAMALIKRVPDLILGIPALVGWQALEGKRFCPNGK